MKRIIYIPLIVVVFVLTISIFIKPVIISLVERQLRKVFTGSTVSIRGCDFKPLRLLALSDIEIKKGKIYDFKVKQISIEYDPFSILKGNIFNFSLKDLIIAVGLEIDSLDTQDFYLESASLNVSQKQDLGDFYIQLIKYDKAKIREIKSKTRLSDDGFFLDSLSAELFGGQVQGNISFRIDEEQEYLVNLEFISLNLETLVNDFELNKKFEITGRLGGAVSLKGTGLNINAITGDFSTAEEGGMLVIKDDRLLENIASRSQQPLDILTESFKDYHYDTGIMRLYLYKGDLVFDISLDGETGIRDLDIVIHTFR